ncbi:hypothetical protein L596_029087 [Steinernema carpocapsae]|uniref:VWFA domain-containing protein n=1 Tax=Steinernema carpocapsae TaxID=34508 RepID=A0A4U5LTL3_STECR|nr:hypothetical protein L596_029087 [Steinernema carpocapsae]
MARVEEAQIAFTPLMGFEVVVARTEALLNVCHSPYRIQTSDGLHASLAAKECNQTPVRAVFLVDLTADNPQVFRMEQKRLIDMSIKLNNVTQGRDIEYSVIAFTRNAVTLLPFNSEDSIDVSKVISVIGGLQHRPQIETSPAKAMDLAADQLAIKPKKNAKVVVIMSHDGYSTDLIAETLEAAAKLQKHRAVLFALTANPSPNVLALIGYTNDRRRVYATNNDKRNFIEEVKDTIDACLDISSSEKKDQKSLGQKIFGVPNTLQNSRLSKNSNNQVQGTEECNATKVDIMIVLDTSGSVYNAFAEERQLVLDLVSAIEPQAFDQRVQIGVVRFAAEANVAVPIKFGRSKDEILEKIEGIEFTGSNTRIADAVELGLAELLAKRRRDAKQVFLLISDGHGQEYWHVVQSTGKRLQTSGVEIYSVTTSRDYNFAELVLYAGDESRVFVGPQYTRFIPTIATYINKCLKGAFVSVFPKRTTLFKSRTTKATTTKTSTTPAPETTTRRRFQSFRSRTTTEDAQDVPSPSTTAERPRFTRIRTTRTTSFTTETPTITTQDPSTEVRTKPAAQKLEEILRGANQNVEEKGGLDTAKIDREDEKREVPDAETLEKGKAGEIESIDKKESNETVVEGLNEAGNATMTEEKEGDTPRLLEELENLQQPENVTEPEPMPAQASKTAQEKENTGSQEKRDIETLMPIQEPENAPAVEAEVQPILEVSNVSMTITEQPEEATNGTETDRVTEVLMGQNEAVESKPEAPSESLDKIVSEGSENKNETGGEVLDKEASEGSLDNAILSHNNTRSVEEVEEILLKNESEVKEENFGPNAACDTDVMFLIDRSQSVDSDFVKELSFAVDLIEKILPEDLESSKVRVAAVSYAMSARLEFGFDNGFDKVNISEALKSIENQGGSTSVVTGIEEALVEITKRRRENVRLMVVYISDGNSQDFWDTLVATTTKVLRLPQTDVYAVTLSGSYNEKELEQYTGDKWKVYIDARVRQFISEIGRVLISCVELKTQKNLSGEKEPKTSLEKIEELQKIGKVVEEPCLNDPIDLVVVLDISTSITNEFDAQKQVALDLIKKAKSKDFPKRIRVALVTFNHVATLKFGFAAHETQDEVLFTLDKIEHTGGQTSLVSGIDRAVQEIEQLRRTEARLFVLIISDGNSRDAWAQVLRSAKDLHEATQEGRGQIFAVTLSTDHNKEELKQFTGDVNRVFENSQVPRFLGMFDKMFGECGTEPVLTMMQETEEPQSIEKDRKRELAVLETVESETRAPLTVDITTTMPEDREISGLLGNKTDFPVPAEMEVLDELVADVTHSDVNATEIVGLVTNGTELILNGTVEETKTVDVPEQSVELIKSEAPEIKPENIPAPLEAVPEEKQSQETPASALATFEEQARIAQIVSQEQKEELNILPSAQGDAKSKEQPKTDEAKTQSEETKHEEVKSEEPKPEEPKSAATEEFKESKPELPQEPLSQESKELMPLTQKEIEKHDRVIEAISKEHKDELNVNHENGQPKIISAENPTAQEDGEKQAVQTDNQELQPLPDQTAIVKSNEEQSPVKSEGEDGKPVEEDKSESRESKEQKPKIDVEREIKGSSDEDSSLAKIKEDEVKANGTDQAQTQIPGATLTQEIQDEREMKLATEALMKAIEDNQGVVVAHNTSDLGRSVAEPAMKEVQEEGVNGTQTLVDFSNNAEANKEEKREIESEPVTIATSSVRPPHLGSTPSFDLASGEVAPKVDLQSEGCKVDLVFIIDTSQSVEKEFENQLQFAVDLVKRLPEEDFENRVNVAVISFHRKAAVEIPFGKLSKRSEVLDALFKIVHTGGSTSAVSGVELALQEIEKGRRPDARTMVVLVSDGNSQDPWDKVVEAASGLRSIKADVYAVTVSHDYYFRELELYAGNKWFVYIDARIRQFLDEAELSLVQCMNPAIPGVTTPPSTEAPQVGDKTRATPAPHIEPTTFAPSKCKDKVDLFFILDTSTSVEKEFYAEKNFAIDLVKVLPESEFVNRVSVALSRFAGTGHLQFEFGQERSKGDVLYELERVEHTGGQTSLVSGAQIAIDEIKKKHRSGARLIIVIVSDGNSQDEWKQVQQTAKDLRETGGDVFAVTLSEKYYLDELKEYTGSEDRVFIDEKIEQFIMEVGTDIVKCTEPTEESEVTTPAPKEATTTEAPTKTQTKTEGFAKDELPLSVRVRDSKPLDHGKVKRPCSWSKMDLIIILDASTSRQGVFEHQRELALSLIERLPIAKDETHVAVGINSFTHVPTLRQTLGLGRDKEMVRRAIEDIKYNGGSTLTAEAVELAVSDLKRGRRPDALQVVVLMNDGMSQDPWDRVLQASAELASTNAERFGVALGDDVDLRELRHYIADDKRIYRDGETERFLTDVVTLLQGGDADCVKPLDKADNTPKSDSDFDACKKPDLDLVVLFKNSDNTADLMDPSINSNRYLLLDVLGSLPSNGRVNIAVIPFSQNPKVQHNFEDAQDRDSLFNAVESIQAVAGEASYAKAVEFGLNYYNKHKRPTARGMVLILGDGKTTLDSREERSGASNFVRKAKGLQCYAVDSSKDVETQTLASYTGTPQRVYNYDRNAEFAQQMLQLATSGDALKCSNNQRKLPAVATSLDEPYSTSAPILRDISPNSDKDLKNFEEEKIVVKSARPTTTPEPTTESTTTTTTTRSTTTTTTTTPRPPTPINTTTRRSTTPIITDPITEFRPGCLLDVMIILDSSGSVEETFTREKDLAADIINDLRVGPNNARISLIKFASKEKVKTVWSFENPQSKARVLRALYSIPFSSGLTAIHSALLQGIVEYSAIKGARPGDATPIAIVFTDGFGQEDTTESANLLRRLIPNTFTIAINHQYPINRPELEIIAGSKDRVFTDENINEFHKILKQFTRNC